MFYFYPAFVTPIHKIFIELFIYSVAYSDMTYRLFRVIRIQFFLQTQYIESFDKILFYTFTPTKILKFLKTIKFKKKNYLNTLPYYT